MIVLIVCSSALPLCICVGGEVGVAFASETRPGVKNAKLRSEGIFEFEHLSRVLRNPGRESADTLEQIFQIGAILGYGFDTVTSSRTTDIRIPPASSHT
ncbi:hypothetical protein [Microbacterium sp. 1.5R]|uniref:hypothetical protein n=1 Tax=Microbacterium sp. 1.5R TaxID=1916917 RepID=UPI0011A60099|nr:hypothetical protein [Microbacterium sp. 1.5R]